MDSKKNALRAEDIKIGIFTPIKNLLKSEPMIAAITAGKICCSFINKQIPSQYI